MSSLLRVELRRFLSRRLVRVLVLLVVAGIAVGATITFLRSDKLSTAETAKLEEARDAAIAECVESIGPNLPEGQSPQEQCEEGDLVPVRDPRFRLTVLQDLFLGTSVPLMLLAWVAGASFIGAEWHAGTLTTQLTWEPRRLRLLGAKMVSLALVTALGALLLQALLGAALLPSALLRGTTAGADRDWLLSTLDIVARAGGLSALAAVLGFSIASVARNTAAALGAGFVYVAIVENLIRSWRPRWSQWLLFDNVALFLSGEEVSFPPMNRSAADAAVILILYIVVLSVAALWLFRQRDVT